MTSPLTPKLLADKNGKLVTRYVKDEVGGASKASSLPAPKLGFTQAKEPSREDRIEEVANIVATPPENPTRYTKTPTIDSVTRALERFKDDSVIELIAEAMNDPARSPYTKSMIARGFYDGEPNIETSLKLALNTDKIYMTIQTYGEDMHAQMSSDFINLTSSLGFNGSSFKGPVTDDHIGYFQATLIANKLGIQEGAFPIKNEYYKQIEQIKNNLDEVVPMLPVLTPILSRDYYRESYDDVASVIEEVKGMGYDPVDIGEMMKERRTSDLSLVAEILNNGTPAMSSGVL